MDPRASRSTCRVLRGISLDPFQLVVVRSPLGRRGRDEVSDLLEGALGEAKDRVRRIGSWDESRDGRAALRDHDAGTGLCNGVHELETLRLEFPCLDLGRCSARFCSHGHEYGHESVEPQLRYGALSGSSRPQRGLAHARLDRDDPLVLLGQSDAMEEERPVERSTFDAGS